jgi:hypothetical protein
MQVDITTAELGVAVQPERTAKPLPCGHPQQRMLGKDPNGKAVFAVRRAKIARQSLCRAS